LSKHLSPKVPQFQSTLERDVYKPLARIILVVAKSEDPIKVAKKETAAPPNKRLSAYPGEGFFRVAQPSNVIYRTCDCAHSLHASQVGPPPIANLAPSFSA